MSIEHVECSSDFNSFFIFINTSVTPNNNNIQTWKVGEAIYGSTAWGCEREESKEEKEQNIINEEGYSLAGFAPISAIIESIKIIKDSSLQVWQVEATYVHMSSMLLSFLLFLIFNLIYTLSSLLLLIFIFNLLDTLFYQNVFTFINIEFFEFLDLTIGAPAQATGYDIIPQPSSSKNPIELKMNPPPSSIPVGARKKVGDSTQVVFRPFKSGIINNSYFIILF